MLRVLVDPQHAHLERDCEVAIDISGAVFGPRGREAFVSLSESGRYEWWTTTATSRPLRNREEAVLYAAYGYLETDPAPRMLSAVVRPLFA